MKIIYAFLLPLFLVSCKSHQSPQSKTISLNIRCEPHSLDPRIGGNVNSQIFIRMLNDGLMRVEPDDKPHLALAKDYDVSEDGMTYIFYLKDAVWTDGDPITSYDFANAWSSQLSPTFPANHAYILYPIKNARRVKLGELDASDLGIETPDAKTLIVHLEYTTPYFLELLANPLYFPVHEGATNGPFTIVDWQPNYRLRLERSPTYWDHANVKLDEIDIHIIPDTRSSLEMFERGEVDWVGRPLIDDLPVAAWNNLEQQGKLHTTNCGQIQQLSFNTQEIPFTNKKIRQAFACAIDRNELCTNVLHSSDQPACSLLPPTLTQLDSHTFNDGNPNLSRTLFTLGLEELGISQDELPPIVLSYWGRHSALGLTMQVVQQQWEKTLGVKVVLEEHDFNSYFAKYMGGHLMVGSMTWMSYYSDPLYNLEQVRHKDNPANWHNPDYVKLLDNAEQTTNPEVRMAHLAEAERVVMDEMPICPIVVNSWKYLQNPKLHGVYISPVGQIDFKFCYHVK